MADDVRFEPGDLLAFSGHNRTSAAIRFFTCSKYSHVAPCCEHEGKVLLIESTTLCDLPCVITGKQIAGVQAHYPADRIAIYEGSVWILRRSKGWQLTDSESQLLTSFMLPFVGWPYDQAGAILSRIREVVCVTNQDLERLFCSELAAEALMRVGTLPKTNAGRYTPARLIRTLVRLGVYTKPERLK